MVARRTGTADEARPRRLLLVTGSMGAGHHAAARAVEEAARQVWPGVDVRWTETLDGIGRAAGPVFRGIYAGCIRHLPWLYDLYFRLLWHAPPFRAGTRAVLGRLSARGLAPVLAEYRPDLVVATFPEGVAGLGRLRRTGRLPVPAVALVTDPAPHPMWADTALDLHLVTTDEGAALLRRAAPGARGRVVALPVVRAFSPPAEPTDEMARDDGRLRVLVSCGSLAFGDVAAACAGALDAGADVLVSTGRSAAVQRRLSRLAATHPRGAALEIADWIADPAAATRAADVVVTNAGGATALEALACARPLVLVDPVPGHGRANAEVLAAAGLARICQGRAGVAEAVTALRDPAEREAAVKELRRRRGELAADLAELADLLVPGDPPERGGRLGTTTEPPSHARGERVRPQDALFLHAATAQVPQQVGARVTVADPEGLPDWPGHLAQLVRDRAPHLDLLRRRLAPPRPGRAARWIVDAAPDPALHVHPDVRPVGPGTAHPTWDDAVTAFFAVPVDPAVGWELQIARHAAAGETAILAKVLHSLGDGLAVTDALVRLFTDEHAAPPVPDPPHAEVADARTSGIARGVRRALGRAGQRPADGVPLRHRVTARVGRVATVVRGVASLALAGPAGPSRLTGRSSGPAHQRVGLRLDGAQVRRAARAQGVGTTVLVLALLAEALHDVLAALPGGAPARVRAMVPLTTRTRRDVGSRASGNRTAAVSVDLPTGPMTRAERVAQVERALAAGSAAGQPDGAAAVLQVLGLLPGALQRPLVRVVYGRRFFHLLASVMPGVRRPLHVRGGLVTEVQPVLPLADGVSLAVGALNWGPHTCVGFTLDRGILPAVAGIPARLQGSLKSMQDPT